MRISNHQRFGASRLSLLLVAGMALTGAAVAQDAPNPQDYIAAQEPPLFAAPSEAVEAFKDALAADDLDGLADLLVLDAEKVRAGDGASDTFAKMRAGAAQQLVVRDFGDKQEVAIGSELWPLPFPIAKGEDGKWAFDTIAGIGEIVRRRVGENELEAMETARAYVDAQRDYASEDRDGDGVLEYARKLLSSEGKTDGLYWPVEQGDGDSPAGAFVNDEALDKASENAGYYGYRFRILTGQGENIAGGSYDFVINDNMIAGFALIAWPVAYGETGVNTFVVGHQGIVYEADLGPSTAAIVPYIDRFNPDDSWHVSEN